MTNGAVAAELPVWQTTRGRWRVISAIGVVQILAWGSSYYLLAVLAAPIMQETGWSRTGVIGGVSVGLMAAGLAAIRVGRLIDQFGGRMVMVSGMALLAVGLLVLALAPNLVVYLAGWIVLGAGMGASLYDASFSTLGRLYGTDARRAISALTLWGGFASTVCWPLSAWLVDAVGWRGACGAYAMVHLFITLPICLFLIPKEGMSGAAAARSERPQQDHGRPDTPPSEIFWLLAIILTTAGMIAAIWSVHLVTILQSRGLSLGAAVALGALVGPAQVGARLIEMAAGGRHHPIWTMIVAAVLIAAGLAALWSGAILTASALMAFGAGNGLWSIARGTLPLTVFGPKSYVVLMGKLATPSLIAQALAPAVGALVLQTYGSEAVLGVLAVLATVNLAGVVWLYRMIRLRAECN